MKIVVAMDSFKGTIPACEACRIIAEVIAEFLPDAQLSIKPMADGGEGTARAMLKSARGRWVPATVTGPLPEMSVAAGFAWFDSTRTALVEMASASGLQLLSPDQYNPMKTTTYGTGQLIKASLEYNPRKVLLAVGGSATVDGGIGAAAALGWKFLDNKGMQVPPGGEGLAQISAIAKPALPSPAAVEVICDVTNPLCGNEGAARVYGPQKGATPQMVDALEAGLANLAAVVRTQLNCEIEGIAGGGAAGGLAAGAVAFMNATLVSGIKTIINFTNLEAELADADWVITGEGRFDRQSLYGKVVSGIAEIAARFNTAAVVIAGQVDLSQAEYQRAGILAAIACKPENMSLDKALGNSRSLLRSAAERLVKQYLV
ncbi:MAG TPA: glycerate kinase [Sedimentisphaerales bacterium]|nr:glycerate kinase [Sedimentisphaerales bacterium]